MKYLNLHGYSDVTPYEVVRVVSEKTIDVRRMRSTKDESVKLEFHAGGFTANCSNQRDQKWFIEPDETESVLRVRLTKKGWCSAYGTHIPADKAIRFHDYNF